MTIFLRRLHQIIKSIIIVIIPRTEQKAINAIMYLFSELKAFDIDTTKGDTSFSIFDSNIILILLNLK